jgi:hypothetical protein
VQGPIELLTADDEADANVSRKVPPDIWRELAERVSGVFDSVTLADLCQRGEALGILRGDAAPHMYFI